MRTAEVCFLAIMMCVVHPRFKMENPKYSGIPWNSQLSTICIPCPINSGIFLSLLLTSPAPYGYWLGPATALQLWVSLTALTSCKKSVGESVCLFSVGSVISAPHHQLILFPKEAPTDLPYISLLQVSSCFIMSSGKLTHSSVKPTSQATQLLLSHTLKG